MKKTIVLLLLCLPGYITSVKAGTWTVQPWTGDASTGIVNGETHWAYHFGSSTSASVNGVDIPGLAGPPPLNVLGQFELTGAQFALTFDTNNLTNLGGSGSAVLGGSFFYGGFPTRVTVKADSMVPGRRYVVSLLSVGWDDAPGERLIKFVSGGDELPADQAMYGENNGLRASYEFVAGSGDQVIDVVMNNSTNRTFHLYAVALSQIMRTVTTMADSGPGSLRQTVSDAPAGALIRFDPALVGQILRITGAEIILDKDLVIDGSSLGGSTTLQGNGTSRLFYIPPGRTVVLKKLSFTGGGGAGAANAGRGGAVLSAGNLTAEDCEFTGNSAVFGGALACGYSTQASSLTLRRCVFSMNSVNGGAGGALANVVLNDNTSTAIVEDCTFTGNSSKFGTGGAFYNVTSIGTANMTIRQSTIANNTSQSGGGGGYNLSSATGATNLTLSHCTIVGNAAATQGGGIYQRATIPDRATASMVSCIIAENAAGAVGPDVFNQFGRMTSLGTNLIGDISGSGVTWTGTDLTGQIEAPLSAGLLPLDTYGSPVPTMPPGLGSIALDAAATPPFLADQRGFSRIVDANRDGNPQADIGAVESDLQQVDVVTDELDTPSGSEDVSLREALRDVGPGGIITFATGLSGQTLTLDSGLGQLDLTLDVTVDASSLPAGLGIALGEGNHRLVEVSAGVTADLRNLHFKGGAAAVSVSGGAILNAGSLSLSRCSFTGLKTSASAGALSMTGGRLEVSDSTFSGNTARHGGAIRILAGNAIFNQCTIHGNTGSIDGGGFVLVEGNTALVHCTITGNNVLNGNGGGLQVDGNATLSLHNSIVAGNTAFLANSDLPGLPDAIVVGNTTSTATADIADSSGAITRSGANVIGRNDGVTTAFPAGLPNANGDYVGTSATPLNPLLGALANNGGPTQTSLPLPNSPALDRATGKVPAVDQRGISRIRDGDGDNAFTADIGAAEGGSAPALVVNTLADELDTPPGANLSLREAVAVPLTGVPITFAPALSGKTITLDAARGEIILTQSVVVDASALPGGLVIDAGSDTNRHLYATPESSMELRGLTFTGGGGAGADSSGFGGAILTFAPMTLLDCTFRDNQAEFGGGALATINSEFKATRCTFYDNRSSTEDGGGLYLRGAAAVLDHCTLTRNFAGGGDGGAIMALLGTNLTLTHCTIAGNTSSNKNGGLAIVGEAGDILTLNSTILAGNLGQDLRTDTILPTAASGGGNVLGLDAFFSNYADTGDVRGITAAQLGLAELGRYGGLTDTMPPLPGSPALDAASLSTATTDQRGFARTLDGNFDSTATSDSGAAESSVVRVTTGNDENDTPAGSLLSLREAVRDAPNGAVITSTAAQLFLTSQELVISKPVILASSSQTTFQSVQGSSLARMLHIAPGARVHLNRLIFSGGGGVGATLPGKGGAILNQGSLSLTKCNLTGAKADFGGAIANGMVATPAWLKMSRCSISTSSATAQGGAIYNAVSSGGTAVAELDNTLIHTNTATRQGGAVANVGGNGTSTFTAEHCTIMKNSSQSSGGGVFTSTASATTRLTSCLIAENTAAVAGPDVLTTGSLFSGGTNLIGIGDGGTIWVGSDLTGTAAAPLDARTGSEVGSFVPRSGSPAIDAAAVTYRHILDRSDNPRILDGDLYFNAKPDMGAHEVSAIRITTVADEFDTPAGEDVSVREAIRDLPVTGGIILLDPAFSGHTFTLDAALGQLEVGKSISLDASALPGGFTIDGGTGTNRLFLNSNTLHLRGLRLTGGAVSGDGGAILNQGTLVLEDCTLSGHSATGSGGAVFSGNNGRLLVRRSTFTGNSATSHGGALASIGFSPLFILENSAFTDNDSSSRGGAIYLSGSVAYSNRMVQCTVAGNRSAQRGGGVMATNSSLSILHCTITQNRATTQRGGGLMMDPIGGYRQTIQNTVIADNHAPTLPDVAVDNQNTSWPLSAGGNLIGQNTGASTLFPTGLPNAAGDYVGSETTPLKAHLAPFGTYGGTTATCPPMLGSPALDKAVPVTTLNLLFTPSVPGSLSIDQRGLARSVDGDFNSTARPDIGAAESVIVMVDVAADELDTPAGTNDVSLREALRDAPEGAVIGFAAALSGQTLTLGAGGPLEPPRSVIISASSLTSPVTLTPQANSRIFNLPSQKSLGLSHLNLTGANLTAGYGGAIYSEGSLSLSDCSLMANITDLDGGAICCSGTSLKISRCVFSGNQAKNGGAIILRTFSAAVNPRLTVEDSVFQANSCLFEGGAIRDHGLGGITCQTTVRRSRFTGNQASVGGAILQFAAMGRSELMLESCTLSGNQASIGGAIFSYNINLGYTSTTLNHCTLRQNSAASYGAVGSYALDTGSENEIRLHHCTFAENTNTGSDGTLVIAGFSGSSTAATLDGCIIAGNSTSGPEVTVAGSGTVTSLGNNLIGKADGGSVTWQPGDLTGTTAAPLSAMLATFGSYGGPTETMPPLPGSPARNPASGATSALNLVDQRGGARLVGTSVDIGAVEAGDTDAPGTIAFGAPLIRVQENVGVLQVPVFRTGGNIGTVEVRIATSAGSGLGFATATTDFTPIIGDILNFGPGETVKYMPVTIVSDPKVKEPHEDFTLTLSNATGGATLGAQSSTTVRILDFTDAAVPSLTLTAPLANAIVTTDSVTVIGTAKDDKGLQAVQVQLNNGAWVDAALTGSPQLSNFSLGITAVPGVNTLNVRAVDEKGKISALTKRSFTYKVTTTLTVAINGPTNSGTVSAGFTPSSSRDVGLTYKITATPKAGFLFTGWSANVGGVIPNNFSYQPTISFVMRPGLTLTARFASIATAVGNVGGIYQGLVTPLSGASPSNATTGFFAVTVTSTTGAVTGSLRIDGSTIPFTGQVLFASVVFKPALSNTLLVKRTGKPDFLFTVSVSSNTADLYLGPASDPFGIPTAYGLARRCPYSSRSKIPTSLVTGTSQRFNLIFPSVPEQAGAATYPPGTGIGSLILGSDGSAKIAGTLADNTTFTSSTLLTDQNTTPLFASLYSNLGHIAGTVNVMPLTTPDYDAFGVNLYWSRPAQPKAQWYPQGWPKSLVVDLVGAKYLVPLATANQSVIPGLGPVDATNTNGNATLTFMDGLLTSTQNFPVNISTKNVVTPLPLKTKNFTLTLAPTTGEITGTFLHTDTKKPTFKATTIQKPGDYQGTYGFFMSVPPNATSTAGQAGAAMLLPRP